MLNCEHESLLPRFTSARPARSRCRADASRDREDLRGVCRHDQTLSETTTRDRPSASQSDSRTSCQERGSVRGGSLDTVGGAPGCDPGRTRTALASRARPAGQSGQHSPRHCPVGVDTQKKTLVAREQDEIARATWREQARQLASSDLVFVDETGTHIALTPLYARAPRSQRAVGKVPRNTGSNTTLLASLSLDGMGEALILEGAADRLAFEAYIEQVLAPSLRPGQIVVMDNLSIHQGVRVRQAIEARGCQLLFLPAYSPDFSPIEPDR